jgi:pimeloyl-ACP methyl ester carboxylesterase
VDRAPCGCRTVHRYDRVVPSPPPWPPEPPTKLPPARTVTVPGRGEMFLRDTGGDGLPVMLLHGWIATADLNWVGSYDALAQAGYRVLAIDHRGHGRGLRPLVPFRLADCAGDAAGVVRTLGVAPAVVVGYSMGGAIAQLVARDHRDAISGLVLSGTAQHWQDPETRRVWRAMGAFGLALSLGPRATWRRGFKRLGAPESERTVWLQSELLRHSARDIAEAGRELSRFDSRPWASAIDVPSAVVLTTLDGAVAPRKQHELASAFRAQIFEAPIRHLEVATRAERFNPSLLEAIAAVVPERRERAA